MTLYDYFRSSASYRVRIGLNLKQLAFEVRSVHLIKDGGEQHSPSYQKLNPQKRVPTLVDEGCVITQSMSILAYLEKKYPSPSLYTSDVQLDAKIDTIANIIACDVHPLNNLSVLQYLTNTLQASDNDKTQWYHHWIHEGFSAIETMLQPGSNYCVAGQVTLADICLIPQVYNAHRFDVDMSTYPTISRINAHCLTLPAFAESTPEVCQA